MATEKDKQGALFQKRALDYHKSPGRPGKLGVHATKSLSSQRDLSYAYSPGVAEPCREIEKNPDAVFDYTSRSNLVGVISNGTAVLGLGDIGPLASKPVMEGKAVLFKKFADIDCFDIEVDCKDPEKFIQTVRALEPTFGGINLEDIKAPECFHIETTLKKEMNIPVFHDDQHGTAIISGAALLNAAEVSGKKIQDLKVVFCGGGAASIACARFWLSLGVDINNCIMTDRSGVIRDDRDSDLNEFKKQFSLPKGEKRWLKKVPSSLEDAVEEADVFLGCSVANALSAKMLKSMAKNPIVFALANPDPEISYELAKETRDDMIFATGRSDHPNQINNVLCFPFMFRGALDVHARAINEEMKVAAAHALADLAKQAVPENVLRAYAVDNLEFGRDYIIPKPLDPRALLWVAPAVAEAAIKSGVARQDLPAGSKLGYQQILEKILGSRYMVMRDLRKKVISCTKNEPIKLLFPEGHCEAILKAAQAIREEGVAEPVFLADPAKYEEKVKKLGLVGLKGCEVIRPRESEFFEEYVEDFFQLRARKGITYHHALQCMKDAFYFGSMHLRKGRVDAYLGGVTKNYPQTIRPNLQCIGAKEGHKVAGVYLHVWKNRVIFLADTTVNIDPTAEELVDITLNTADLAQFMGFEPRVAMLSFSNFGSNKHPEAKKVRLATELIQRKRPELVVDGEMQADVAVNSELLEKSYPFSKFQKGCSANILIFPNLTSANTSYKLLGQLGGAEMVGPILVGMKKPVHILQRNAGVHEIVHMAAIAAMEALALQNRD